MRTAALALLRRGGVVLALVLAGCAQQRPASQPPAPVTSWSPSAPVAPAPADPDETFHGVRFGASRADVLRAYPNAACTADRCTGSTQFHGLAAAFFVFEQADGSWIARLTMAESTAPGAVFNHLNDALTARYRHQEVVIEDDGNRLRWHPDAARQRQVVLRRCASDHVCRGLDHGVIEVAFFEQEPRLGRPW